MTKTIDKTITDFISKHHALTLATIAGNQPWCASCFYAWDQDKQHFVYTTDLATRHGKEAIANRFVSANILLETSIIGKIQGLQIAGETYPAEGEKLKIAEKRYLKRFPYARLVDLHLWILEPNYLKLTHNQLGFGKKLIWQKNS